MSRTQPTRQHTWALRGLPLVLLILSLGFAPAALAGAGDYARITVNAPGSIAGSPVVVQYQDLSGNWITVDGWQGTLDGITGLIGPYKSWTVFKENFGQGPFRWVIYNYDGKSVWGISDPFNLPSHGTVELTLTVIPGVTGQQAPSPTPAPSLAAATADVASTPPPLPPANPSLLLKDTGTSTFGLACCGSVISGYFSGLPATSWIVVEWGDGFGDWTAVPGWQGPADSVDTATGQLIKHWSVAEVNYDQGPFRWAVYDGPGGTLLGYSTSFTLPARAGLNFFMSMSR